MDTLRTLIVDGDAADRRRLRSALRLAADIDVVGTCADGRAASAAFRTQPLDLIFLTVPLPDGPGLDTLAALDVARPPAVIVLSTDAGFALQAFERHAADYLLKPIRPARLHDALAQARLYLQGQRVAALHRQMAAAPDRAATPPPSPYLQRISVRNGPRVSFIDVGRVDWMEAADNYVCLHVGPARHLVRSTLSALAARLDPAHFLRIHRSHIVNIGRIRAVHPRGSGDALVVLDDGTELRASRTYGTQRRRALRPFA